MDQYQQQFTIYFKDYVPDYFPAGSSCQAIRGEFIKLKRNKSLKRVFLYMWSKEHMLNVELNMYVLCLRVNIRVYRSCIKYNQTSHNAKLTYLPKTFKLHSKKGLERVMSLGKLQQIKVEMPSSSHG